MGTLEGEGECLAGAASFENATDFVSENPTDLPQSIPRQLRAFLHTWRMRAWEQSTDACAYKWEQS
jgi:hypothetical protein